MPDKELLEYYIKHSDSRFDKIDMKLDELIAFRWQIIGGSVVMSSLFTLVMNILFIVFGGK